MLRTSIIIDCKIHKMTQHDEEVTEQPISCMVKHGRYTDHRKEIQVVYQGIDISSCGQLAFEICKKLQKPLTIGYIICANISREF